MISIVHWCAPFNLSIKHCNKHCGYRSAMLDSFRLSGNLKVFTPIKPIRGGCCNQKHIVCNGRW